MDVATKVNFLFHAIMQAVQTYLKNVEMFIYNSYPDKLFVLVDFIINASKICFDRKVFDKTDANIVKMLRKSVEMKRFLEINQKSAAIFEENKGRSLQSRHSYAHERPKFNEKHSIYGKPQLKRPQLKAKSPYDIPQDNLSVRNLRTTPRGQKLNPQSPSLKRATPVVKSSSPKVRKSISNISTMVQKEATKGEEFFPKFIKSFDKISIFCFAEEEKVEVEPPKPAENPKELTEIMEMLRSVAKEKIQELLSPYLDELTTTIKQPRVTSDIKPQKLPTADPSISPKTTSTNETVQRIAPNIQYLFVESKNDSEETLKADETLPSSCEVPKSEISTSIPKPPLKTDDSIVDDILEHSDNEFVQKTKKLAHKERRKIIKSMVENPLYVNEQFDEPWKLFADVSNTLIDDMLKSIVKNFDFGERKFVDNFFKHELVC